jgi:hypothetical protein
MLSYPPRSPIEALKPEAGVTAETKSTDLHEAYVVARKLLVEQREKNNKKVNTYWP